jgi:hypothetical protein
MRIEALIGDDDVLAKAIAQGFSSHFGGAFVTEGIGYTERWQTERSFSIATYTPNVIGDRDAFELARELIASYMWATDEESVLLASDGGHIVFIERQD